jgi:hypothetical protein
MDLLTFPQQNCPDVLVLGLLQINPPITILRQAIYPKYLRTTVSVVDPKVISETVCFGSGSDLSEFWIWIRLSKSSGSVQEFLLPLCTNEFKGLLTAFSNIPVPLHCKENLFFILNFAFI